MASQNMSPRQKMINMMYLVLTALLALNISNEILQAFEKMRSSLETTSNSYSEKNTLLADAIKTAIDGEIKNSDSTNYKFYSTLSNVRDEAQTMVAYLEQITGELREIGEVDEATGQIIKKDERDKNYRFWMGPNDASNGGRGNGKAAELRDKLNQYIQWANQTFDQIGADTSRKSPFPAIKSMVQTAEGGEAAGTNTWEFETFHGTPVIADLAMVEKFKMDIKEIQSVLLQEVRKKVDGPVYKINKLMPMEAPASRIVPAGMEFTTRLFVGMSSDNIHPEFLGNGIKVDPSGQTATMTIAANGGVIPAGQSEGIQRYSAMIKVPKANGTYEELPLQGEFIVRQPEVVVRSATVQQLYKDCGNNVIVDVPALGDMYNPDFSRSTGGRVKTVSGKKKEITLIPSARKFNLSVYSKTNGQNVKIDNIEYDVILPPEPRMAVEFRGRELDQKAAVSKRQSLTLKLIPNKDFKRNLPQDARYKCANVKLYLHNTLGSPKLIATKTGNVMNGISVNLNQGEIKQARAGDRIIVEITNVSRVNFQGKAIPMNLPQSQLMQAFVLR